MKTKRTPAPKREYDYRPYPESQGWRSGNKVSWLYYDNREDAEAANKAAAHNAVIQRRLGYDFGYCAPGWQVEEAHPSYAANGIKGKWEVCIP